MASYNRTFAAFYDRLISDVDHSSVADFCLRQMQQHHPKCELILDLACGTGILSAEFARRGYETIGVDASPEMLSEAAEKNASLEKPVLFVCQPMERLDLFGTVDLAACVLDSLNHLSGRAALRKALHRLQYFVEPGGLFIFDMNTPYKHDVVLGSNTFVQEAEGVYCVWQNECEPEKDHRITISLDFFAEQEDGSYLRSEEHFCECAYPREVIAEMLSEEQFDLVGVYGDYHGAAPGEESQRLVYVAQHR